MARRIPSNPKFVKTLSEPASQWYFMRIPPHFILTHGSQIAKSLTVKVGKSYEAKVQFDGQLAMLNGIGPVFNDFQLTGGETLIFELKHSTEFRMFIVCRNHLELDYVRAVNPNSLFSPALDRAIVGGLKFVFFLQQRGQNGDGIEPPTAFMEHFDNVMPREVQFLASNGINMSGRNDNSNASPPEKCKDGLIFEVLVRPFHTYDYCYGVDIGSKFHDCFVSFGERTYIEVYEAERSWRLQIRKRKNCKRLTIHDGWIQFRLDLKLGVGDKCIFIGRENAMEAFDVTVVRGQ